MSSSRQEQHDDRPTSSRSFERIMYERAFVQTVLQLLGTGSPRTFSDWSIGRKYLFLYDLKVAVERSRHAAFDTESLVSGLARLSAVEHAFMLVRFGSVLPPTEEQLKALDEWRSGTVPHAGGCQPPV